MKWTYPILALILLASVACATDFVPSGNINLRDFYNITNLSYLESFTILGNLTVDSGYYFLGDIESKYVKDPPAAPAAGYAMSYFDTNFSTVVHNFFNIDSDEWLGNFDAMGYSLTNATHVNSTNIAATNGYFTNLYGLSDINLENNLDGTGQTITGGTFTDGTGTITGGDGTGFDDWNATEFYGNGYKLTKPYDVVVCRTTDTGCDVICTDSDCGDDINAIISEGKHIYFKDGQYPQTTQISVSVDNVTFSGTWASEIYATSDPTNMIYVTGDNFVLDGMKLNSNNQAHDIIEVFQQQGFRITNCLFSNPDSTTKGRIQISSDNGIFSNNYCDKIWIINIVDYSDNVVFSGNTIYNSYDSGVSVGIAATTDGGVQNIAINGNTIMGNLTGAGFGIDIFGYVFDVSVSGNSINGSKYDGIIVQADGGDSYYPARITISGNVIENTARHGISVTGSGTGNVIIDGNIIYDITQKGIQAAGSGDITVSNNHVVNTTTDGIWFGSGDNYRIIGNTVINSSQRGIHTSYCPDYVVISENTIMHIGYSGIETSSNDCSGEKKYYKIHDNLIYDVGTLGSAEYNEGISLKNVTNSTISENMIIESADIPLVLRYDSDYNHILNNHYINNPSSFSTTGTNNYIESIDISTKTITGTLSVEALTATASLDIGSYNLTADGLISEEYFATGGAQGITDSSSYWLCNISNCSTACQVTITDGLITGCT